MHPDLRVSDEERDAVVEILRGHLLAGRLDPEEHEERVAEACRAKYERDLGHVLRELPPPAPPRAPSTGALAPAPPRSLKRPGDSRPGASLALGITGSSVLIFTLGFGAIFALPLGVLAWVLGAQSAQGPADAIGLTGRSTARTGMWLGVVTTVVSLVALAIALTFVLGASWLIDLS